MRSLDIPVDSAIAVNSRSYRLQSKAEQEQLKRLVLQNERRQETSDLQCMSADVLGSEYSCLLQSFRRTLVLEAYECVSFIHEYTPLISTQYARTRCERSANATGQRCFAPLVLCSTRQEGETGDCFHAAFASGTAIL